MSQADLLRLLIPAVLVLSGLGCAVFAWWEKRHPSSFQPVEASSDEVGRRAVERASEINSLTRP
ncbi:hypothetical protein [Streptomyces caniscabiei]|uniref:hypothetical protein n=1 Tax=Streptomyces caniscabiei TaxID=2746961 RepID=UPI00187253DD|nr:hypothetical protein [Streptomyces caniscabiei]MBE4761782.1 hypothetical protein [Streptomyces caniscabiei]MDX2948025.1 hypothetical protein [Streptomyces caniscabiei]MDX2986459.1 hypothetical protein [Streptomyces caniscabiei]